MFPRGGRCQCAHPGVSLQKDADGKVRNDPCFWVVSLEATSTPSCVFFCIICMFSCKRVGFIKAIFILEKENHALEESPNCLKPCAGSPRLPESTSWSPTRHAETSRVALHVLPLANPTLLAPGFTGSLHPVSLQSSHSPSSPAVPGLGALTVSLVLGLPQRGPT